MNSVTELEIKFYKLFLKLIENTDYKIIMA